MRGPHLGSQFPAASLGPPLDITCRTVMSEQNSSLSSSLCSFLHSPVTSPLLGPNTLLNTLSSNTLSLRSSRNISDQVPHPYRTRGKTSLGVTRRFAGWRQTSLTKRRSFTSQKTGIFNHTSVKTQRLLLQNCLWTHSSILTLSNFLFSGYRCLSPGIKRP